MAGTWCRSSPRNRVTKSRTRRSQRSIFVPFTVPFTGNAGKYIPFPRLFQAGNGFFGNCARGCRGRGAGRPETRDLRPAGGTRDMRLWRLARRGASTTAATSAVVQGLMWHVLHPMRGRAIATTAETARLQTSPVVDRHARQTAAIAERIFPDARHGLTAERRWNAHVTCGVGRNARFVCV